MVMVENQDSKRIPEENKSIPTHFQGRDNYHTLQSFVQHLGANQAEVCILWVLDTGLIPALGPKEYISGLPECSTDAVTYNT